jgi:hypothetical protein
MESGGQRNFSGNIDTLQLHNSTASKRRQGRSQEKGRQDEKGGAILPLVSPEATSMVNFTPLCVIINQHVLKCHFLILQDLSNSALSGEGGSKEPVRTPWAETNKSKTSWSVRIRS